jgi:manganese transport protein
MQDFVHFTIPMWVRRLVTMIPAFVVVGLGVNSTQALVMSQVVLSIVLPIPMVALLLLTARRDVMGGFVNKRLTTVIAVFAAALVLALNLVLLAQAAGVSIPYLPLE